MKMKPSGTELIPLNIPTLSGREWKYVKDCFDTNWVSSVGSYVDRFEYMLAEWTGRDHAVATVNGTAALHTALLVAGIGEGDEVILPALTFIASGNAVRYTGAWPVFLDVSAETWQLDPVMVGQFLGNGCRKANGQLINKRTGRRVKAIMPVHILGHPVDMDPVMELAREYSLLVIEDAAEALGALYKNKPAGTHGDIACFSFNGNKIITSGGGGMLVTDNLQWAQRARHITTQAKADPVEYEHDETGFNYRLTNIQAAMGCAQMEVLEDYVQTKRAIAARYSSALETVDGIVTMREASWARSTFWMYTVLINEGQYGSDSRKLLSTLSDSGIMCRPLWQPLSRSPVFKGAHAEKIHVSEDLYRKALSIPCSVGLTEMQQSRVIDVLRSGRLSR